MTSVNINLDAETLTPIVQAVAREMLAQLVGEQAKLADKLCYSEPEAARLLSLQPHQLRDERLRGRIKASKVVGRRVRYLREDLLAYLMSRRV